MDEAELYGILNIIMYNFDKIISNMAVINKGNNSAIIAFNRFTLKISITNIGHTTISKKPLYILGINEFKIIVIIEKDKTYVSFWFLVDGMLNTVVNNNIYTYASIKVKGIPNYIN